MPSGCKLDFGIGRRDQVNACKLDPRTILVAIWESGEEVLSDSHPLLGFDKCCAKLFSNGNPRVSGAYPV